MSLGGNDETKHDNDAPTKGSGNHTTSSKGFTINDASTTICINSPPMIIIARFTCIGTRAERQGSAAQDTLFGTRGRRQE